ncbi:MAG: Zn-ribbon domain-containing OB-fold protein [Candidatus Dormibacteraeota bacterium]|nr:Zn-ribbon domain-containing OB-fold protein [Candidatus Dormibacteraeota bacterium]
MINLDPPRLLGSQCQSCGNTTFPPQRFCPACGRGDGLDEVELSTRGTVYSFTVVRQAPPGVAVPYVLAYVDLREQVRVMCQLTGAQPDDYEIGMECDLELTPFGHGPEGAETVGFRFRVQPRVASRRS